MERESITMTEEDLRDVDWGFGETSPLEINGETYNFIEDYPSRDCDGECHNVVVQRESDKKYFRYFWMYTYSKNYRYEEDWEEVFRKEITTITWE